MPTDAELAELLRTVQRLAAHTQLPSAEQESKEKEEAKATAVALRKSVCDIATTRFGITPSDSSEFSFPEGASPSAVSNPYPRPQGVAKLSPNFALNSTAAGQKLSQGLGASSGFFFECVNWIPIVSAWWDSSAVEAGLLPAEDTPDETASELQKKALKEASSSGRKKAQFKKPRGAPGSSQNAS